MSDAAPSGFGNAQDAGAGPKVVVKFIDDGGIGVLPDGAMIYVTFAARPCPPGNGLSYANFGDAFFGNYCRRCHSAQKLGSDRNDAPVGLNFDDLPTIRMLAARIWSQAGDSNRTMPAGAPLPSSEERTKLGEWLACGAP